MDAGGSIAAARRFFQCDAAWMFRHGNMMRVDMETAGISDG
jgi:hypothetical protein